MHSEGASFDLVYGECRQRERRQPVELGMLKVSKRRGQWAQYSSESYRRMLNEHGIRQSMSRAGCPYDNACSESFFATAKKECIYLKNYATMEEVKRDIFEYVEIFYNRKRMHSYLGYMSPVEYRLAHSA